ncbi:gamete-expressed 3 [Tasmannia lanceolata]|uniref:gamete-expressed 3 n=1 Tax=Tasmannia lanceolata TaxID=3420 RepID=UPI004064A6EF
MEAKRILVQIFLLLILCISLKLCNSDTVRFVSDKEPSKRTSNRLSRPLIGNDGRIYTCFEKNLISFQSNGTIAWVLFLNYSCQPDIPPVSDEIGKIYLVAEDRVLKIKPSNIGTSESAVEVFFGPEASMKASGGIIGLSINIWTSSIFINVKKRGLFAYMLHGQLLWSAGPVLYRFGYRQGCKENVTDCYFSSAPVIDHCEGSVYISNTEGQLYSLSVQSPHFNWIKDFSSLDKLFMFTPGNNGHLYLAFPRKAVVMALDVSTGNVLWQSNVGPLSPAECSPVVDSNGWVSIGSLDGFLYSFSPTGVVKKFLKATALDLVQVSPLLDCSGYAVYVSQTRMEAKTSHTIGEFTYISATKPTNVVFIMLVPATGALYWNGKYSDGQFSSLLFESDLRQFTVDESILLAFITSAKMGKPLPCHTTRQKLASSCSQANTKYLSIYTGNERTILLFLLLQFVVLMVLSGLVRFCCIFWRKKKLQHKDLGKFLEKRRSLHEKRKEFDRMITELEQKVTEEAVANEVLEKLGDMVKEREGIERKLSTTYSLGRDGAGSESRSLLPLYNGKTKSYSFQSRKNESMTIFHTLSDTSSGERSISSDSNSSSNSSSRNSSQREVAWHSFGDKESAVKAKAPMEVGPSSSERLHGDGPWESPMEVGPSSSARMPVDESWESPPGATSGSKGYSNPLFVEQPFNDGEQIGMEMQGEEEERNGMGTVQQGRRRAWLKRRRTLSSK